MLGQNTTTAIERRAPRTAIALAVGLRRSGSRKVSVDIKDVSTHGFKAEVFEAISSAERVWLTLPGLEGREATVAWTRGYEIGCEFVSPLHPAVLSAILAKGQPR